MLGGASGDADGEDDGEEGMFLTQAEGGVSRGRSFLYIV